MLSAEKAKTLTEKYKGNKQPLPIIHIFKDNAVDIFVYVLHIHALSKPVEIIFCCSQAVHSLGGPLFS